MMKIPCLRKDRDLILNKITFDQDSLDNIDPLPEIKAREEPVEEKDFSPNSFLFYLLEELTARIQNINDLEQFNELEDATKYRDFVLGCEGMCPTVYDASRATIISGLMQTSSFSNLLGYLYSYIRSLDRPLFTASPDLIKVVSLNDFYGTMTICNNKNKELAHKVSEAMACMQRTEQVYFSKIMRTFHEWIKRNVQYRLETEDTNEENTINNFYDESVRQISDRFSSYLIKIRDSDISRLLQKNQAAMKSIRGEDKLRFGDKFQYLPKYTLSKSRRLNGDRPARDSLQNAHIRRLRFQSIKELSEITESPVRLNYSVISNHEDNEERTDPSLSLSADRRSSTNQIICGRISLRGQRLKSTILYNLLSNVDPSFWFQYAEANQLLRNDETI